MKSTTVIEKWLGEVHATNKKVANDHSTLFFEGNFLYSFGHHYIIARKFDFGKRLVVNSDGYSKTTTKQTNWLIRIAKMGGWKIEEAVNAGE